MADYVLSPLAEADLDRIYDYTYDQWGVEQFQVYRKALNRALEKICQDPSLPGSQSRDDLSPGCRVFRVERHYLVYRIQGQLIEVGRVLHERMNFEIQVDSGSFL